MLQDEKEYLKLLKVIGNNQKYDFYSQLSIYNKEPEASDSLNENIFSLSRIYGDKYIHLALTDLRIDIEDRLSFEKFMRDSISYAVANRFNTAYPLDIENLKNNFSRINTISLEQIGLVLSRVSEDIIDKTIEKSKEMDRARLLTERAAADYNRDIENINEDRGGQNDLYRRDDRSRSRDGRVFTDGSDRGNSDEDRRENLGYESKYQILNAMDFGIPQKRERNICFQYLFAKMIQDNWNK